MYIDDRAYLTPPDNDSQSCATGDRKREAAQDEVATVLQYVIRVL